MYNLYYNALWQKKKEVQILIKRRIYNTIKKCERTYGTSIRYLGEKKIKIFTEIRGVLLTEKEM